jgi:hypothetical protein
MTRRLEHYAAYLPHNTVVLWVDGNTGYLRAIENTLFDHYDGHFNHGTVLLASVTLTHASIPFCIPANLNQLMMVLRRPSDDQKLRAMLDPDYKQELIRDHYDVFGLIERKEAVNAGALPFEPYPDYRIVTEWKLNPELIDVDFSITSLGKNDIIPPHQYIDQGIDDDLIDGYDDPFEDDEDDFY